MIKKPYIHPKYHIDPALPGSERTVYRCQIAMPVEHADFIMRVLMLQRLKEKMDVVGARITRVWWDARHYFEKDMPVYTLIFVAEGEVI